MDIADVDLNLLVVFDALLRERSVSATAHKLGLSQPAASFALKRLRVMLGDPLFVRTARGIHPTPFAERISPALSKIIDSIRQDILQHPSFDASTARRTITLNMLDVGELVFLTPLLSRLAKEAPGITVHTVNLPMKDLESALRSGDVDLAIGHFPELHRAALFQQRLFTHSFVCLVKKDHPTAEKEMTRKQFLNGAHGIVHGSGHTNDLLSQELEEHGLDRRVVLRIGHYLAVPTILSNSDIIFTVPFAIAEQLAQFGDIKLVRLPFKAKRRVIKQFWHDRVHHDPANRWLRSVIADLFLESNHGHGRTKSSKR
jgi:DNA-binding transcriptional LysR family regulator